MPNSILVDTDVLVDFLRGHEKAIAFVNEFSPRIILSVIVVAELYAGVKGNSELTVLENFISLFRIVPLTAEIAKIGGLYKRDFGKSHGVGLADAVLAATADAETAELKTLNVKHYPMLSGLVPAYKK
ncbi:MAG: type II toxin-antitoxin system VapC family toxin [Syntrophaceae bacterium]|nr:type II toxin-antitoxin system VapC family toxin [Syntrophaceae bacterium]